MLPGWLNGGVLADVRGGYLAEVLGASIALVRLCRCQLWASRWSARLRERRRTGL